MKEISRVRLLNPLFRDRLTNKRFSELLNNNHSLRLQEKSLENIYQEV